MSQAGPSDSEALPSTPFMNAIRRIDAANREDPESVMVDGASVPGALLYSRRMSAWLDRLEPNASDALKLAARAQHLRRWAIPRSQFPATRAGYLQWRTRLGAFHAEQAGEILRESGYDDGTISRVQSLLRKEGLKSNPETQLLEDVICLVFLENYFAGFAPRHDEEKVVNILRKTWRKMSDRGRAAALGLTLPGDASALVAKALAKD
jgi:hypothetical protein